MLQMKTGNVSHWWEKQKSYLYITCRNLLKKDSSQNIQIFVKNLSIKRIPTINQILKLSIFDTHSNYFDLTSPNDKILLLSKYLHHLNSDNVTYISFEQFLKQFENSEIVQEISNKTRIFLSLDIWEITHWSRILRETWVLV